MKSVSIDNFICNPSKFIDELQECQEPIMLVKGTIEIAWLNPLSARIPDEVIEVVSRRESARFDWDSFD